MKDSVPTTCLYLRNPAGGFASQHVSTCAFVGAHLDGALRINSTATHHVQHGITREHPHGAGCLNACGRCADRFRKREGCKVTEEAILARTGQVTNNRANTVKILPES